MRNFFRKKKNERADLLMAEVEDQFKHWDTRFRRLEEAVDRLHAKMPQVTVENVHIHQPVLEKLEFRLDGLDIEHLSGSLNLGNNFGAKAAPESKTVKSKEQPKTEQDSAVPGFQRTSSGFRFNNRR